GELSVTLAGVNIAEVEERSRVKNRQQNSVARRHVADVEVAAPFPLAIETRGHLTVGRDAESSNEGRDRPRETLAEVESAVTRGATGTGCVTKNPGRVVPRKFRPAG